MDLKAEIGLAVDTVLFGIFENFKIYDATAKSLLVTVSNLDYGSACSWNRFANFLLDCTAATAAATACGLHISGTSTGNSAHNTFDNIAINYGSATAAGTHGINLGYSDNNRFMGVYLNRTGGSNGYGVQVRPAEATNFPINNVFFHLQAGDGGWQQPGTTISPNFIFGYMRDNGQPDPVSNSTPLYWVDDAWSFNVVKGVYADIAGYAQAGTATVFGKEATVAANGDLDTTTAGSGVYVIRNATDGLVALVMVDMGGGSVAEVNDASTFVTVGADPGAASSQFWVTVTGTTLRVRNRYAASKGVQVSALTTVATPA